MSARIVVAAPFIRCRSVDAVAVGAGVGGGVDRGVGGGRWGVAGVGLAEEPEQVGGFVGVDDGEPADVGRVGAVGAVAAGGGGGAVSGDVDGVAGGPVAEHDAVDVEALGLGEDRGDAGAVG